jgi:hypothetical protein
LRKSLDGPREKRHPQINLPYLVGFVKEDCSGLALRKFNPDDWPPGRAGLWLPLLTEILLLAPPLHLTISVVGTSCARGTDYHFSGAKTFSRTDGALTSLSTMCSMKKPCLSRVALLPQVKERMSTAAADLQRGLARQVIDQVQLMLCGGHWTVNRQGSARVEARRDDIPALLVDLRQLMSGERHNHASPIFARRG